MHSIKHKCECCRLCHILECEAIRAELPQHSIKSILGLLSIKELAEQLHVPYETVRSRITAGHIPQPEVRLKRRAYYTKEQAHEIAHNWKCM